ncbi:MAG TPA: biopolymer transporter ExbD [Burkholderiaceae bacterium]|nr:biopolymer transporter ExbD [Burkholderiaceae bacterium]
MPFGGFERHGGTQQPMSEINVTPLVDVMLVLLVIFIITAPLLSYAIRLDLPNDPAPAADVVPATVRLSIDASGQVYWESDVVSDDEFRVRLATAAWQSPLPELNLRADKATRYERIAFVLSTAQQAGLARIGFVTEPATTTRP